MRSTGKSPAFVAGIAIQLFPKFPRLSLAGTHVRLRSRRLVGGGAGRGAEPPRVASLFASFVNAPSPFGIAGLWENWRDPAAFQWVRTFAIITVPVNSLVSRIHDQMPAILAPDEFDRWLGVEPDPRNLMKPSTRT